jgi:hypothetical protein
MYGVLVFLGAICGAGAGACVAFDEPQAHCDEISINAARKNALFRCRARSKPVIDARFLGPSRRKKSRFILSPVRR